MDSNVLMSYFNSSSSHSNCALISMKGRTFPVEDHYLEDIIEEMRYTHERAFRKTFKNEEEKQQTLQDLRRQLSLVFFPFAFAVLFALFISFTLFYFVCFCWFACSKNVFKRDFDKPSLYGHISDRHAALRNGDFVHLAKLQRRRGNILYKITQTSDRDGTK